MFSDEESDIITPYKVVRIIKILNILFFPIRIIIGLLERIYKLFKHEEVSKNESFLFNEKKINEDLNNE